MQSNGLVFKRKRKTNTQFKRKYVFDKIHFRTIPATVVMGIPEDY